MNLIVFTQTYPFAAAAERTFLEPELRILQRRFSSVTVVPERRLGELVPLPEGIGLDLSLAERMSSLSRLAIALPAVSQRHFWHETVTHPLRMIRGNALKRLIVFRGRAQLVRDWFMSWEPARRANVICYSFWFEHVSFGLCLAKHSHQQLLVVSRAHGFDLYEERHHPPYWPCRKEALRLIDAVFSDSQCGTDYLRCRHPKFQSKYITARLGVNDTGFLSRCSTDGVLRVVSCSPLYSVKRPDLMADSIECLARLAPDNRVEWHHHGNGELAASLIARMHGLPRNCVAQLHAYVSPAELYRFYHDAPIDVFLNLSSSEGTPVAIMEAIACGIPVVATAVGGNCEIVTPENGILVPANPTPETVANELIRFRDPVAVAGLRAGSRRKWREEYNAEINYNQFSDHLIALARQRDVAHG